MKRIQEKVKDIVEVRSYVSLQDFTADAAQTLVNYHFTDATSELMAKWLTRIASVQSTSGAAFALAGYRGVGKSHFLATLGALVSSPDLRSRVTDTHVASAAQRLQRRHYPIAYVRRGTHETLLEEFKAAISKSFDVDVATLGGSLTSILQMACERSGELPFILMIDTAFERGARVSRDDGPFLGEIAEAAKGLNVFLGVALDDDIAGADGSNSAIARTYTIDFLDQEHLYKVVNAYIFPKNNQMQPVLHDVYDYFRAVLPNFRWSEQRFSALYPLHPVVLDISPFVRLYVHNFALLGFASTAAERILGRPANSLITLDEVFDVAEKGLREIGDLAEAFAAYDKLNSEVVAKIPVMQRLQAKLVLKALLLLSLDGRGTTAGEISASMLIFDESDPSKAVTTVENLIKTFTSAMPDDIQVYSEENRELRYGFKVSSKDDLNKALVNAASAAPPDVVPRVLRRLVRERFLDCTFSTDANEERRDWMDCQIVWRGGLRRGRVLWQEKNHPVENLPTSDLNDWEVCIDFSDEQAVPSADSTDIARVYWRPDELRKDEIDTILRFYTLNTDSAIRGEFGEQIRASLHAHSLLVEKILNRILLEDGKLVINGFDYNYTEEARAATTLADLFSIMLEPLFETRYPEHPYFSQKLGMSEVAVLVNDLYSGTRHNFAEVQDFAHAFGVPLGLVKKQGDVYVPESEEAVIALPNAAEILRMVNEGGKNPVTLKAIYTELRKPPYGLVHEAQHLILTSLVAHRQIEFVTSKGDRITRRSLDLKIIWDDIIGVAKPLEASFSNKKLVRWAIALTGDKSIKSLEGAEEREKLRSAFREWIEQWNAARVLEKFDDVPDDLINVKIWRIAARTRKSLGSVADNVAAALEDTITFEECLSRVSDAFSDSEEEMARAQEELTVVDSFVNSVSSRETIYGYLAVCDPTGDEAIEELREKLIQVADRSFSNPSDAHNRELGYLWDKFRRDFGVHFAAQHDAVMKSHGLQERFAEIRRSDRWWQFENLSAIDAFEQDHWQQSKNIFRQFAELDCRHDVRQTLDSRPFCICSFMLTKIDYWQSLPDRLIAALNSGLDSYQQMIELNKEPLIESIQKAATGTKDKEFAASSAELVKTLQSSGNMPQFSSAEITILQNSFESIKSPAPSKPRKTRPAVEPNRKPAEVDDVALLGV